MQIQSIFFYYALEILSNEQHTNNVSHFVVEYIDNKNFRCFGCDSILFLWSK